MTYYRQCTLTYQDPDYPVMGEQVAWIPEEFAIIGKYIKIKDQDGWRVKTVGSRRQSEDYVQDHERDFLGHRKRTDV